MGIGADEQRAQTLGVNTRLIKIAGFAMTAAVAGGGRGHVRALDLHRPAHVFNPSWLPDRADRADRRRHHVVGAADCGGGVQPAGRDAAPQARRSYMMSLGLLLILSVLYLPGAGLAALGDLQGLVARYP